MRKQIANCILTWRRHNMNAYHALSSSYIWNVLKRPGIVQRKWKVRQDTHVWGGIEYLCLLYFFYQSTKPSRRESDSNSAGRFLGVARKSKSSASHHRPYKTVRLHGTNDSLCYRFRYADVMWAWRHPELWVQLIIIPRYNNNAGSLLWAFIG